MLLAAAAANKTPSPQQPQQHQRPQVEDLRRDILESAIIGREQARSAQNELDSQGRRLIVSLARTRRIAAQTEAAGEVVDRLISERKAGPARTILDCCFGACLRCCCGTKQNETIDRKGRAVNRPSSPVGSEDDDAEDAETIVRLDRLIAQSKQNAKQDKTTKLAGWKQTLEPLPAAPGPTTTSMGPGSSHTGVDIWYRQVDACLSQLQQIAEDMGDSLDEQIKLAQILAIYLDFGADQAMRANEKLAIDARD